MSLTTVSTTKASTNKGSLDAVRSAVKELQGLKQMVVTGGAAGGAGVTATGLATADKIVGAIFLPADGTVDDAVDVTAEATIPAANKLRLATTNSTGGKILLTYIDVA